MRRNRWIRAIVTAAVLLGLLLGGCGRALPAEDRLTVTLLSVGKADAIVLRCGGETMVIDTGEADDGRKLVEYLTDEGIGRVDVLIITHFDRDHVGGAALLAEKLTLGRVLLPDYESDRAEYTGFMHMLELRGIVSERLQTAVRFKLGSAEVLVEPPEAYLEDVGDNDMSLITTVIHGEMRLVFMGDSEKLRTRQWLAGGDKQPCDFLKVPHHGTFDKALPELLQALRPRFAAICDSARNPAEAETLDLLADFGATVYRTAEGTIRAVSDGRTLHLEQDN